MHIVITRPKEDSLYLMENLIKSGHEVTHLPVIKIEKLETKKIDLLNYQAVIFTSSNAIRFMNIKKFNSKIKCFCVGNATEKKARSFGFQNITAAEGNVTNLKELIIQSYESKNKELLYVSGETISVDLDQQLLSEGFKVKRIINYRVDHNQKFDEKFVNELKLNMPDMVYVYSQNSASSFLNFIKIYQTENLWMNTNLMCIGEKTSSILNEIKWKKIFLFNPGEEEFLLYKI